MQRLKIISLLFILIGSAAWLQFVLSYAVKGDVIPGIEMILLPAGLGLLRHDDNWRKVSLGIALLGALVVVMVPVLGYTISPVMHVRIFGTTLAPDSTVAILFVFLYATLLLGALLWVTVALCNKEVRDAFSK